MVHGGQFLLELFDRFCHLSPFLYDVRDALSLAVATLGFCHIIVTRVGYDRCPAFATRLARTNRRAKVPGNDFLFDISVGAVSDVALLSLSPLVCRILGRDALEL